MNKLPVALSFLGIGLFAISSLSNPPRDKQSCVQAQDLASTPLESQRPERSPGPPPRPSGPSSLTSLPPTESTASLEAAAFNSWARAWSEEPAEAGDRDQIEQGLLLAKKHRDALRKLIREDPRGAIRQAVPISLRQSLPPQVDALLEERINVRAPYLVFGTSPGTPNPVRRYVDTGSQEYEAYVYGRRESQPTTENAFVTGIAVDGVMAVDERPLRLVEEGEQLDPGKPIARISPGSLDAFDHQHSLAPPFSSRSLVEAGGSYFELCCPGHIAHFEDELVAAEGGSGGPLAPSGLEPGSAATGHKSILYLRVAFPDILREPQTEGEAYSMLNQLNDWFVESSFGKLSLHPTVPPLIVLPRPETWYTSTSTLRDDAFDVAKSMGYDHSSFDLFVLAYQDGPGNFNGLGSIGSPGVWLKQQSVGILAHELGHNFGLWHANYWRTTDGSPIGAGSNVEYGNLYDTMGSATAGIRHFSTYYKSNLNWLPNHLIHEVETSGIYRIHASDQALLDPTLRYGLLLKKDSERDYWAEVRQLFDQSNPSLKSGILVNWDNWTGSNGGSSLLDMTPDSPTGRDDAALTVGRTFSDPESDLHMTVLAKPSSSPKSIDVAVNVGPFPANQPPSASVTVDQSSVSPGTPVQLNATAIDPDGDPLAFSWDFGDGDISDDNSSLVNKTWNLEGEYLVRCLVSDMKGHTASDSVVVTVGSPPTATIQGQVIADGQPLPNVHISNGEVGSAYRGTFTNSDGSYTLTNLENGATTLGAVLPGFVITPLFSNPLSVGANLTAVDFEAIELVSVSIAVASPVAVEGGGSATITLSRTGSLSLPLSVIYSNLYGDVDFGEFSITPEPIYDYSISRFVFTIPAGQQSLALSLTAPDDGVSEGAEEATMEFQSAGAYVLSSGNTATVTIVDGGSALPVVSVASIDTDALESGNEARMEIRRLGSTDNDLMVSISLGGEAQSGVDFDDIGNTATIPAGSAAIEVPVTPIDDSEIEGLEDLTLTLLPNPSYLVSSSESTSTIFITDDDIPTLSIVATDSSASESGPDPATMIVTRTGDSSSSLTVLYAIGGTAHHGVDYAPLPGVLEIPAGSSSASITIEPVDDGFGEPLQDVTIHLSGSSDYAVGAAFTATATITDNDVPVVTIGSTDGLAAEPSDSAQFQLTTRGSGSGSITVNYSVGGTATAGVDYTALSGSVTMDRNTTKTITITPLDDGTPEDLETVILAITPDPAYSTFLDNIATVNLVDDEQPAVSVYPDDGTLSEDSSSSLGFYLQRTGSTGSSLTVQYAISGTATNGVDYQNLSGTATIESGQSGLLLATPILPDAIAEGTETVVLTVLPDPTYGLGRLSATRYLPDDEVPGQAVGFGTASGNGPEDTGLLAIPVTLSAPSPTPVTVEYLIAGGSATGGIDYELVSGTLTFDTGETVQEIPLMILDDPFEEPDQTIVIELRHAGGAMLGINQFTYTITDNDGPPPASVGFAALTSDLAEGAPASLMVALNRVQAGPVTIDYAISGGSATSDEDFLLSPGTLTFLPGETARAIPLTVFSDALSDPGETMEITLSNPSGAALTANLAHLATVIDVPFLVVDTDGDGLPDDWEIEHGLDPLDNGSGLALNGGDGDGDDDKRNNHQEYALASDPNESDLRPLISFPEVDLIDGKTYFHVQYARRRLAPGLAVDLLTSIDLLTWDDSAAHYQEVSTTPHPDGVGETVVLRFLPPVGEGGSRRFGRLRISTIIVP